MAVQQRPASRRSAWHWRCWALLRSSDTSRTTQLLAAVLYPISVFYSKLQILASMGAEAAKADEAPYIRALKLLGFTGSFCNASDQLDAGTEASYGRLQFYVVGPEGGLTPPRVSGGHE